MVKMIVSMVLAIVACVITNKGAVMWDTHNGILWGALAALIVNIGVGFLQTSVRYQWRERAAGGVVMRCVAASVSAYCGYYVLVIGWHHLWTGFWSGLFIGLVGLFVGGGVIGFSIFLIAFSLFSKIVEPKSNGRMLTAEEFYGDRK